MKPVNTQRFFHHLHFIFLPVILALLFAVQNQAFNNWLNLFSSQYSIRLLFASFALGLIIYSPCLFFKKKGRYVYLFIASFWVSLIFLSQFLFFQYGQSFLQFSALKYIGQTPAIFGTVITFISFKLFLFVANIFVVSGAFALTFQKGHQETILSKKEKIVLFVLLIAIAFFGYYFLVRQEKKEWGDSSRLYKDVYDFNTLVEKIGIMNFSLEDTFKYIVRSNLVTAQDKTALQAFAKSKNPAVNPPAGGKKPSYFGIDKNKNIIFIQVESLENAVINQTVNGQEITPNLNKLARAGLYFSNYYTQVGPGNTADAEFSTLNSLYPLPDDVAFVDYAQNHYNALPSLLRKQGYSAYALNGDVPTFWNRSNIYPNLGYQEKISKDSYISSRPIGKGPTSLGDEDFLLQSLPKLQSFKKPFFATLITESSHTPFELPEDLQTLDLTNETDLTYTQQQYLESVHYADKALGEFIEQLKVEGLYQNSIIAIYGDHQSFTNISDALNVGDATFPALKHSQVPLIILAPGINVSGENKTPSSHLDLMPTILNLAGINAPKDILGQDMLNAQNPVVVRRNIFSGTINTILSKDLAFIESDNGLYEGSTCLKCLKRPPCPWQTAKICIISN